MKNVLAKLQQARMKLIATTIKKSARNEFAKYNYMELADFLIPAQTIFSELGIVGIVSFTSDLATLTITDLESGEQVYVTSPMSTAALKGCHEVQNLGAVQTYLRRYLWVAALEIVEHDAIDSSQPIEEKKLKATKITPMEAAKDDDVQTILNDPQEREFLQNLAAELVQLAETEKRPELAYAHAQKTNLTNEEKLALWELLAPNSKTRAAIKNKPINLAEVA